MNVLVTGANGFIGRCLLKSLIGRPGIHARGAVRSADNRVADGLVAVGCLNSGTDWSSALSGIDVVVHTAARTNVMQDDSVDPLAEFRKVNVDGAVSLARQAARSGVRRFIFISSIKVNGEQTEPNKPFTADSPAAPKDPYGISKFEAERGIWAIGRETGLEVVVIRPPLIYGPGVKGNFASLVKLVNMGLPLPLGAIHNTRSLVALDNVVDLIVTCIDHRCAANQVFLAGDGRGLSTTELLRGVARAMGKRSRLVPVPARVLMFGAALLGKKAAAQRLLCSLQVDISKTCDLLGWQPPLSVEEGLARAVRDRPR